MTSQKEPQCVRCGHLATAGYDEGFLEAPCSHLYCAKCVHRISCATCGRAIFRHELSISTMSKDDQFFHIVGNTRKRVCGIMSKDRSDFDQTPPYDDFLEKREDLINMFVSLYDTTGTTVCDVVYSREELEKILHRFEVENQEQIIQTRSTAEDRKRSKIEEIIATEGTLYDRVNVDYSERDSVIDHELAVQYSDLLSNTDHRITSLDLVNRRTRQIKTHQPPSEPPTVPQIVEASGCRNLWFKRALNAIQTSFFRNKNI